MTDTPKRMDSLEFGESGLSFPIPSPLVRAILDYGRAKAQMGFDIGRSRGSMETAQAVTDAAGQVWAILDELGIPRTIPEPVTQSEGTGTV